MPELTITGLQVLLGVSRLGSFSAAAEALGYTQSAISRQVAGLEAFAGAPLFERHARGVRPTAAGEVLIRHAGAVLDRIAAATNELAGLSDRLEGRIAVGAFPTAAASLVPTAVARLIRTNPGLRVRLIEAPLPARRGSRRARGCERGPPGRRLPRSSSRAAPAASRSPSWPPAKDFRTTTSTGCSSPRCPARREPAWPSLTPTGSPDASGCSQRS